MEGWEPDAAPGFGWPPERPWINPSPNAASVNMARAYAGTVMLEGTTLSEGRGTTRPLELFGAPDIDAHKRDGGNGADRARTGSPAARCATSGSSRPSTSMSASCATASSSTPRARPTTIRRSARGGSRRWPSRRSARSIPTTNCGAISLTNMNSASSRSTSSTAAPSCANGSMTRKPRPGDLDALVEPDEAAWRDTIAEHLLYR